MNLLAKRFMPATIKELALWSTGLESAFDSGGWEESCLRPLECCNTYLSRNQQWNVTIEHHLHTPKNVVSETRQLPTTVSLQKYCRKCTSIYMGGVRLPDSQISTKTPWRTCAIIRDNGSANVGRWFASFAKREDYHVWGAGRGTQ